MSKAFTHAEIGAFLMAVGHIMQQNDLCAGAAVTDDFTARITALMWEHGLNSVTTARVEELRSTDLEVLVNYVNIQGA